MTAPTIADLVTLNLKECTKIRLQKRAEKEIKGRPIFYANCKWFFDLGWCGYKMPHPTTHRDYQPHLKDFHANGCPVDCPDYLEDID
jgi:hypothetical protein